MRQKLPFLISLLAIIGGVFISILFGVNEELFKSKIAKGLEKNIKIQTISDESEKSQKLKSEADKNWRYYQRYHFHAGAIGTLSIVLLILIAFVELSHSTSLLLTYSLSFSGFLYPFVWLFAGIYGPEMGRSEAKEAFAFFGYMGGVYLLSIVATMIVIFKNKWKSSFNP
jgi:hypothetical protein